MPRENLLLRNIAARRLQVRQWGTREYVCFIYIYIHTPIYIYTYTNTAIYTYTPIYIYMYTYVCIYIYMYIFIEALGFGV